MATPDRAFDQRLAAQPVQLLEVPGGVIVKRGVDELVVTSQSAAAVAAALTRSGVPGGATYGELVAIVRQSEADADPEWLIQELCDKRMLVDLADASTGAETPAELLAWGMRRSPAAVRAAFETVVIEILGVNAVSQRLVESLLQVGARVRAIDHPGFRNVRFFDRNERLDVELWRLPQPDTYEDWCESAAIESSCLVACSDFGGLQRLAEFNAFANGQGRHFLPVVLQNAVGFVGPLSIPGETACLECLLSREAANSTTVPIRRALEQYAFEGQLVAAYHPSMASATGDVAAMELTKQYAYGWTSAAIDNVIEVNLLAASTVTRPILKAPNCAVCSPLNARGRFTPTRPTPEPV